MRLLLTIQERVLRSSVVAVLVLSMRRPIPGDPPSLRTLLLIDWSLVSVLLCNTTADSVVAVSISIFRAALWRGSWNLAEAQIVGTVLQS